MDNNLLVEMLKEEYKSKNTPVVDIKGIDRIIITNASNGSDHAYAQVVSFRDDIYEEIERIWSSYVRHYKDRFDVKNNPKLCCVSHEVREHEDGKKELLLELGVTDYKHIVVSRLLPQRFNAPQIYAVGTRAVVSFVDEETKEQHYIFGRRNHGTGFIETIPGGYLSHSYFSIPRDFDVHSQTEMPLVSTATDPFLENTKKEFVEETGLDEQSIAQVRLLGAFIIEDYVQSGQVITCRDVNITYSIIVRTSREQLSCALRKAVDMKEHSEHFVVPSSELYRFVREHRDQINIHTKINLLHLLTHSGVPYSA